MAKIENAANPENHPGEMRSGNGPTRLIVYGSDFKCSHSVVVSPLGDDVRFSDLDTQFTCNVCGRRGAHVRPLFETCRHGHWLNVHFGTESGASRHALQQASLNLLGPARTDDLRPLQASSS